MKPAIYRFLFPSKPDDMRISLYLLAIRIFFGLLLMNHGVQKWGNYQDLSSTFPDPLGLGSHLSLILAIFAEVACSIGFILGLFYRLALIPMILTVGIAFFVIHGGDAFAAKELALIYLFVFILMYIIGPGRYSLDRILSREFIPRPEESYKK